jgi:hypothetical protein
MNPSNKSASKKDTPKLALDYTISPERQQALAMGIKKASRFRNAFLLVM